MKNLAEQIAEQMNSIMDSSDHKAVFRGPSLGKFASKKDDDSEGKKKDCLKEVKKAAKEHCGKCKCEFDGDHCVVECEGTKEELAKCKKAVSDVCKKHGFKCKFEGKENKKASLDDAIEGIARISAKLDDLGLVKSALQTIRTLEVIAEEAKDKKLPAFLDKDNDGEKDDKYKSKKEKEEDEKEDKKDKKEDDKSDANDASYSSDHHPSTPPTPNADFKGYPSDEYTSTVDGHSDVNHSDENEASCGDSSYTDHKHDQHDASCGDSSYGDTMSDDMGKKSELNTDQLIAALKTAGINLTSVQKEKFKSLDLKDAHKVTAKLMARKFETLS